MSGSYFQPIKREFLNLSGGTVTGSTTFALGLSANTLSATTFYSGSTSLGNIFSTSDYYTTGSTFSAATKIATFNRNDGGSYELNLSALTTIDTYVTGITFSSTTLLLDQNEGRPRLTAPIQTTSLSGILSSSTFNIYTTGGMSASTFYVEGSTILSGSSRVIGNLSASTLYSGSTNLYDIFSTIGGGSSANIQAGSNITTGGTSSNLILNLASSPSINNLSFSGTATGLGLSATTISGSTLRISGSAFVGTTSSIQWGDNGMAGSINGFLSMASNGVFRFGDSAGGGSPRIIMGSAGAATGISLKRNGTSLDLRLGDDSGFASLNLSSIVANSTSQLNGAISSGSLSGTTSRMVEVSSGGTLSASKQIISAYITSGGTIAAILENESNWDLNGDFTGSGITGTYQGQKYYNYNYFFEAIDDNVWIRLIRG